MAAHDEFGGEFPINVAGPRGGAPAVGMDADGDFLVAWREQEAQRAFRILGRRYDRAGTANGLPFQVNTSHGASRRTVVSVAMNHSGQSVVAWDGAGSGMAAQLFDGAGNRLGDELAGEGSLVSAVMADDGHGAVAAALGGVMTLAYHFDLSGNWGQRFGSGGGFHKGGPAAAMAPNGRFVVVWTEEGYYGSFLRGSPSRFAIGGGDLGAVSTSRGDLQPSVAMGDDGVFLVVWRSTGIFGQWFDGNAKPREVGSASMARPMAVPRRRWRSQRTEPQWWCGSALLLPALREASSAGASFPVYRFRRTRSPTRPSPRTWSFHPNRVGAPIR